jgi:hypothetical protein
MLRHLLSLPLKHFSPSIYRGSPVLLQLQKRCSACCLFVQIKVSTFIELYIDFRSHESYRLQVSNYCSYDDFDDYDDYGHGDDHDGDDDDNDFQDIYNRDVHGDDDDDVG